MNMLASSEARMRRLSKPDSKPTLTVAADNAAARTRANAA